MIIYKATNKINGLVYVGQTKVSLKKRIWRHKGAYLNKSYSHLKFYQALKQYGLDAFVWEEIDVAQTTEELNEKEMFWIEKYNSFGDGGYNSTKGGRGITGLKHSQESLKKFSQVQKGRPRTEETKSKHRVAMIGVNVGEKSGLAKLTEDNVREIKRMISEGVKQKDIAATFNVNKSTITLIKKGERWAHIK